MIRPSRRVVLLIVAALLLGGVLILTTSDVVQMATSGGVEELREPLRTIRGETRVLLVGLDGVGGPVLYDAIRDGDMPNVAALVGAARDDPGVWEHGYGAREVMSVLPAETTAGWTAVFTGARPADSGVPGNEWFIRDSLAFYAPVPLSVESHAHTVRIYSSGLVGARIQVPTLFERIGDLRSHVSLGLVWRGADVLTPPNFSQLPRLWKGLVDAALGRETVDEELYEALDRSSSAGAREAAEEHGLPDLQFVYFPGIDLLTHASESPLEHQREQLSQVIDPAIGELLDLYRTQGVLEDTYVLFVADHGHTPRLDDDAHSLDNKSLALLDSLGLRVRDPELQSDSSGRYNAVYAANESFAFVYLADRSTCPDEDGVCDWNRPPRLAEDVLPVARALRDADESGAYVPALEGTFDLILVREPRPLDSPAAPYQVLDGDSLTAVGAYLARNPRSDLPHFEERMSWLSDGCCGHHAGDILVLAFGGPNEPLEERYYFAPPYHSGHGGASMQDGAIPLLLAQPRTSGADLRELLHDVVGPAPTQLSVAPLVIELLERNGLAAPRTE